MEYIKSREIVYRAKEGTIAGIEDVQNIVDEIEATCEDFSLAKDMFRLNLKQRDPMNLDCDAIYIEFLGKEYFMRYHSLSQYVNLLLPAMNNSYIWHCLMQLKGQLALNNLQSWEFDQKDPFFVRTIGNEVRAFLSNRFADYQNRELLDIVQEKLLDMDSSIFVVSDYYITENIMNLYLEEDSALFRDFKIGLKFQNSEVGLSAVNVHVFVRTGKRHNIVFQNKDMRFVSQKHIGKKEKIKPKIEGYISQIKVFADKVQTILTSGEAMKIDFFEEGKKVIEAFKLTKAQESKFNMMLSENKPKTKLDLAEYIASLADLYPSLKDEFEVYAGKYLTDDYNYNPKSK